MGGVLWGCLSALCLGSADFMARFGTRALGARSVYLVVLAIGASALTVVVLVSDAPVRWSAPGMALSAVHGLSVVVMSVLLYTALARGPISMVAPIVAAHPVLVLAFAYATGARPEPGQWLAMAAIVAGVVWVARRAGSASAEGEGEGEGEVESGRRARRITLLIAGGASVAHAAIIISGQAAVPYLGELQTTWVGRLVGLAALLALFALRRERPRCERSWVPFLVLLGILDTGGYLALFAGSTGPHPEATAVAASTFGVVTVILARIVLRESITRTQWTAIAVVFGGVAALAGTAA